jgi:integrase
VRKITTDASVKAAKPDPDRQIEYPDSKVAGLALRVTPARKDPATGKKTAGGKKTWTLRYRTEEGEQRRLTIGVYPAVSLTHARTAAWNAIGEATRGGDPAKEKRAAKAAARARKLSTVSTLLDAYFDDAAKGRHRKDARPKRASTLTLENDYSDRLIRPRFGSVPIDALDRHAVQAFLDEVSERTPAGARICRAIIRQAYNYGIRREVVGRNPAQFADVQAWKSRERVLTDDELRKIWSLASNPMGVEGLDLSASVGTALCFAMVTLQRGGEVCGLHADEIDRQGRLWIIPGERTKNHRSHAVPLSSLALDLLGKAFGEADWRGFAFPSPHGKASKPITRLALTRACARVREVAGIDDATPHDFRRTGTTALTGERIGIPRFIASRVINHISDTGGAAAVTSVYDRNEYLPEKRRALDAWAALLIEIVTGEDRPANVVRLIG